MKPQPPVTNIRIAARTSSGGGGAPADFPTLRDQLVSWQASLAQTDWVPWMIIGLAALLRFFLLGMKPPHFDEGINGWFVDQMVKSGFYKYDPTNYHGPLHFYTLFLSQTLLGRNLWALRLPVVLVSISCVWLTFRFEPFFGRTAVRIAAVAMALSPGFIFYGRYSIHEVWLLLFSMMFLLGLLGLWKFGSAKYLWCFGLGLTGMVLTKETYVIHIGCAIVAAAVAYGVNLLDPLPDARPAKQTWSMVDLVLVFVVGTSLIVFFYSGTFLHWNGVKDIFKAYSAWLQTGHEGHGHEKSFYYWLKLMAPSFEKRADFLGYELPALAGLILCISCLRFKNISVRYLAIYGVGTLIAYSIVHYKTPWCIISIIWPFLFVLGTAVASAPLRARMMDYVIEAVALAALAVAAISYALWIDPDNKWELIYLLEGVVGGAILLSLAVQSRLTIVALLLTCLGISLGSTISLNYFRCTTDTEPYVYVQTYNDIYKLTKPVLRLAKQDPVFYMMTGHIIRPSSYPLPWMLDDFPHVGYYEHDNLPPQLDADFLLVQEAKVQEVEAQLHESYFTDWLTIRSFQEPSKLYFSTKMFKGSFPNRSPDFIGQASPP